MYTIIVNDLILNEQSSIFINEIVKMSACNFIVKSLILLSNLQFNNCLVLMLSQTVVLADRVNIKMVAKINELVSGESQLILTRVNNIYREKSIHEENIDG